MERRKRPPPANRPTPERKSPPGGNNLVWLFTVLALVTLLAGEHAPQRLAGEDDPMAS